MMESSCPRPNSGDNDEEKQAFLSSPQIQSQVSIAEGQQPRKASRHLRWILELAMAVAILKMAIWPFESDCIKTIRPSPVPTFPRKTYTFFEEPKYLHEDMFSSEKETLHTLHSWIPLSAAARGYVQIGDTSGFGLSDPYIVPINHTSDGPAYMMALFHQLHCLSYIVQHFQSGYGGVELTQEVAHHSAHCFDYLRQSIMCAADTSLEGKTDAGPGWGSVHECKDYDAVVEWANKHGARKWKTTMPLEAVL